MVLDAMMYMPWLVLPIAILIPVFFAIVSA